MMNRLYYGDNLDILRNREYFPDAFVDLIYLDPPFNSNRDYNVLFADESGEESEAQITAFEDTWHWNATARWTFEQLVTHGPDNVATMINALKTIVGANQMMAYLVMMTARLVELHRVLKPTGSLYLHCDTSASHYLKVVLDAIFGAENFQNEITWKRTTAHNNPKRYGRIQDRILYYAKSKDKTFNQVEGEYSAEQLARYTGQDEGGYYRAENLTAPGISEARRFEWRGQNPGRNRSWAYSYEELERLYEEGRILLRQDGMPRKDGLKVYLDEAEGPALQDIWTDIRLGPTASERLGYPTQKPLALLERIVAVSSNPGDIVLDPFCGCGTAIAAAQKLGRQWLGIDITHLAIALQRYRLENMFPGIAFEVIGEPKDVGGASQLAEQNRYQFQWWALSLVRAKPLGGDSTSKRGKKGADRGIDGVINFLEANDKMGRVIIQVKSGKVKSGDVRDLRGTLERETAAIAVFITLEAPTKEMLLEATEAGYYHSKGWGRDYPRLQILTIEQLLKGERIAMPQGQAMFKQAERADDPNRNKPLMNLLL